MVNHDEWYNACPWVDDTLTCEPANQTEEDKVPGFYKLGATPWTDPDDLWLHYGYYNGKNNWWDWGFGINDWTMPARRRIDTGMVGSPGKTYKEDSWDENKVVFDLKGEQRTGDVDNPEFYTLSASGTIDAKIENMELIDKNDGSLLSTPDSDSVAGKIVFPNSGFGAPKWGEIFLPIARPPAWMAPHDPPLPGPPSIGDVGPNPIGGGSFFDPDYVPHILHPRIDPDPGMSPYMPFGPGSGSGSNGGMMMSAGYNDPNFGLPSDGGGSFIGLGRMKAACNIPNEIQPAIPPDGLFGPDGFMPGWHIPGYHPAPDIVHPLPLPIPIPTLPEIGGGNLPGRNPSPSTPGFGLTATSYGEILGGIISGLPSVSGGGQGFFVDVSPAVGSSGGGASGSSGDPIFDALLSGSIVYNGNGTFGYSTTGGQKAKLEQSAIRQRHRDQAIRNIGSASAKADEEARIASGWANRQEQSAADFNRNFWHAWNSGMYREKGIADALWTITTIIDIAIFAAEIGIALGVGTAVELSGSFLIRLLRDEGGWVRFSGEIEEGVYLFEDLLTGLKYIGQASDLRERGLYWIRGKNLASLNDLWVDEVLGGKTAREIEETKRIMRITRGRYPSDCDSILNKNSPVSERRWRKLGLKKPKHWFKRK